tara:strand:+ start:472 stop:678 length:207 start_codon:yes stop_codon:yes gene_type:complete
VIGFNVICDTCKERGRESYCQPGGFDKLSEGVADVVGLVAPAGWQITFSDEGIRCKCPACVAEDNHQG